MASEPLFGVDLGEVRNVKPADLVLRFVFGAAISVIAGASGAAFGATVGGLLLAFPAILPATLTLIERRDGNAAAIHDVGGAIFGGVGLVGFGLVATIALGLIPAWGALMAALGGWVIVGVSLYVARATGWLPLPASIRGRRTAAPG